MIDEYCKMIDKKTEKLKVLIEALNGDEKDEKCGEIIFDAIDNLYNTFGSYSGISEAIRENLNENGLKRFWTVWAICGMELAWHYIYVDFDEWDDRKKASEIYAYKNILSIEEMFEKNCGAKISFDGLTSFKIREKNCGFSSWLIKQIYMIDEDWTFVRNNRWIERLAQKFTSMHSTLKQSYFGGVVKMMGGEEKFPFI